MTYWERRAVDSIGRMESAVNGALPELVQSFEAARQDLQREVEAFYGRYARQNAVTLPEAQRTLSSAELRAFRGNLREYERLARQSIGIFDLQVENLATKVRITRLQALETRCDAILQRLYQAQRRLVEKTTAGVFTEEYYRRQFSIEQYTGFQFPFPGPATSAIQRVLKEPVQGADISTRLWRQDMDTGFRIRQTLHQMFATGKPPQHFAEELQKVIGAVRADAEGRVSGTGKKYEAYRLLYNEASYATGQAHLQAYHDDELDEYEIVATLDLKTSEICQRQDGKVYPVSKAVVGVNYPPFHVNCRTTTAPHIPGLKDLPATRMARDPETGKSVRVENQNYGEWRSRIDGQLATARAEYAELRESGISRVPNIDNFLQQRYNDSPAYQMLMRRQANAVGVQGWRAVEFNPQTLGSHFEKHGGSMGFKTAKAYGAAAVKFSNTVAGKAEIVDVNGIRRFYSAATNEFAAVYPDGTISTYYKPRQGLKYWERQVEKYGGKE